MMKRRGVVAGALVAAVVALGLVVWALMPREAAAAYVTASASRGSIVETVTLVGPVEREGQASVSYATGGIVTAVHARLGDQVAPGQPLVTIDDAPLRLSVLQARAQLAQAEAQLDADLAAQKAGTSRTAGVPSGVGGLPTGLRPPTSGTSAPSAPRPPAGAPGGGSAQPPAYVAEMNGALQALQAAVKRQQEQCTPVFAALQRAREAASASPTPTALPTAIPSPLPTALPSAIPSPLPTALPSTVPSQLPPGSLDDLIGMADQVQACSEAMVALAQAEVTAGAAIQKAAQGLADATQQAQRALAEAQEELQRAARQASEEAIRAAQQQLQEQMAASFGGSVTDATIANDRARLVEARQKLASAEADLANATLTSPVAGTVGALDFAVGEPTSGRSLTVVAQGAARVTVQVPLANRSRVVPGVAATAGALAEPASLSGRVVTVSVLPTSAGGAPTYAAEVVLEDPGDVLRSGSYAEVRLSIGEVADVLTVPASAVTRITDTTATVEVVATPRASDAEVVTVVTGRVGGGRVEIVSGLADGQLVVLADRRLPVPGGIDQYAPPQRSATPTPTR